MRNNKRLEEELRKLAEVCNNTNCIEGFDCAYRTMKNNLMKDYNLTKPQFYAKLNYYSLKNENFGDESNLPMFFKKQAH